MQILKDDVREKITRAAIREFGEKGYRDSSMRVIAQNAGIVMGNIYRYFKSKEELFNKTVGPVYSHISSMTAQVQAEIEAVKGPWTDEQAIELIRRIYGRILETFSGHGTELMILLDKSAGSVYKDTKKELIGQIESILRTRLSQEVELTDPFICHVIAAAFVEGICVVLRDTGGHNKEAVIGTLTNVMLCQISKRL
jgi:AcrR family transcriptional regulator